MVVVAVAAIALIRRQIRLGIAAVSIIVIGQVITQVLKRFVLPRPGLVETTGGYTHNSLPSGHTTVAVTVLLALVPVVPYRLRGLTILVATPWAVAIAAYTITAKWHRFSDTLAADAVALAVAWFTRPSPNLMEYNNYLGANTLAAGGCVAAVLVFWWTVHRVSLVAHRSADQAPQRIGG